MTKGAMFVCWGAISPLERRWQRLPCGRYPTQFAGNGQTDPGPQLSFAYLCRGLLNHISMTTGVV